MRYFLAFALIAALVSCGVQVNYDYDRTIDFTQYKTYNYFSDINTGLSELDNKRLFSAFDTKMQDMGFAKSDNPDFLVDIRSSTYQDTQQSNVGIGVGGTGGDVGGGVSVGIPLGYSNLNREIIFNFVDQDKGLIWQAISAGTLSSSATPTEREDFLQRIVDKVLDGYPPKAK